MLNNMVENCLYHISGCLSYARADRTICARHVKIHSQCLVYDTKWILYSQVYSLRKRELLRYFDIYFRKEKTIVASPTCILLRLSFQPKLHHFCNFYVKKNTRLLK